MHILIVLLNFFVNLFRKVEERKEPDKRHMRKFILPVIILLLVAYITIRENKIYHTLKDKKELSDTLQKLKSKIEWQEKGYYNDLQFNWIVCSPIYDKIVRTDDTLSVKVVLTARNTVDEKNKMSEAYVNLGKDFDSNNNLIGIYDTINAKDWLCEIKIKTHGLGNDSIVGTFNIPWKNNTLISYPFKVNYLKIDKVAFKNIQKFKK